jgi:hypothetical protein
VVWWCDGANHRAVVTGNEDAALDYTVAEEDYKAAALAYKAAELGCKAAALAYKAADLDCKAAEIANKLQSWSVRHMPPCLPQTTNKK